MLGHSGSCSPRSHGEQVAQAGDTLWIYYPARAGRSRLSLAIFDRLVDSPVTARNWCTVLRLVDLSGLPAVDY